MEDGSLSSKINGLTTQIPTQNSPLVQEPEELAPPAWRNEEVDKIINKLTPAEDKPKITGALLGMLGSVRPRTQRQNPHVPPLCDDIRDGDIIPKSDLLQCRETRFQLHIPLIHFSFSFHILYVTSFSKLGTQPHFGSYAARYVLLASFLSFLSPNYLGI